MEINFLRHLSLSRLANLAAVIVSFLISRVFRKPVVWGGPVTLSVEPTNHCNLKCPECPSGLGTLSRPLGLLKKEDFLRLVDQISSRCFYIQLFFQGEPFINKQLSDMINYARSKRIYTSVSTNGLLFNDEKISAVLDSPPDKMIFSIDGMDQPTYEKYRVGGRFEEALGNMKSMIEKRNQRGQKLPFIEWQFIIMKSNEHQLGEVRKTARQIGVDKVTFKTMQVSSIENALEFLPLNEKYRRYRMHDNKLFIKSRLHNHCFALWRTSVITWDGKVVPCCFDKDADFNLGNLNNKDLLTIWKSEQYNNFRQMILSDRKSVGMCKNCTEGLKINIRDL